MKVVRGRRFIVSLDKDYRLTEALEQNPQDVWHGTWSFGRSFEKDLYPFEPTVGLHIGRWLTMLAFRDSNSLVGIERNSHANPRIATPPDYEQNKVELFRQI